MPAASAALTTRESGATRGSYEGTGGQMFGQLFVGFLLMAITFGLYAPWFMVRMYRYTYSKTSFGPTGRGRVRFEFTGTGGSFFVTMLVGMLLSMITFFLYYPWFLSNLIRYFADNSVAIAEDGTRYQLRYEGTGGQLFVTLLVGALLCGITFGLYAPWLMCKLYKQLAQSTRVLENGQASGGLDFVGTGGDFFGQYIVGMILTMITFGIYAAWFQVRMNKWMLQNLRVSVGSNTFSGDYDGTGGELFVAFLVGGLLCMVTAGIYFFWFFSNLMKLQLSRTVFKAA